ncbi:MAG: hypothetical protein ACKOPM_10400 [Novosphingobium sp.]
MKKLVLIAALAALSACSKPAPAPEPAASETAEASDASVATVAADGKASVGKFKITSYDGKVYMEEDKADGTYVTTQDGKVVETGKWEQKSPGTFCFTKDEKDAKQVCNEEKVENGVWTTTNAKGEVSKVERVEG